MPLGRAHEILESRERQVAEFLLDFFDLLEIVSAGSVATFEKVLARFVSCNDRLKYRPVRLAPIAVRGIVALDKLRRSAFTDKPGSTTPRIVIRGG
jgi:hypothetical protein